jgi:hypothetical protein
MDYVRLVSLLKGNKHEAIELSKLFRVRLSQQALDLLPEYFRVIVQPFGEEQLIRRDF